MDLWRLDRQVREVKEFNMKLGNATQVEWEMLRDENLREEQMEKEIQPQEHFGVRRTT